MVTKKQDNPKTEAKAEAPKQSATPEVKMAPLKPSVEQRLEALEQSQPRVGTRFQRKSDTKKISIQDCNRAYHRVAKKSREEKRDAFAVAKKALASAFAQHRGPKDARRQQKDLHAQGAEARAEAAQTDKSKQ